MKVPLLRLRLFALAAGAALLAFSGLASADPPSRVARVGYISGAVSFSPAGEDQWVQAAISRPLTTGDRLWADASARAEIQLGGAMIRVGANTGLSVLNLDDRIAQLQLTQGTLNFRVRRLESGQVFEVDTPNLAFTVRQPGAYRIEVDPAGDATTVFVREGRAEVYGEDASYLVDARQPYRFTGTGLREYQYVEGRRLDEFDHWSSDRDRIYDSSVSARYVSQDVVGYQDLDGSGTWRVDATYGNVWFPSRVAEGWAPYSDGHWAWVDPWGWTWMDEAPWGFAVSHYGRWAHLQGAWGWVPGPARTRAYYAPALVAFVGGSGFQLSISGGNVNGVAWFPLAPREVYRPSYPVSRGYFENVNRSNTVVNTTVINNFYNRTSVTNVTYANRQVTGAVVAVPTTTFVRAQPISRDAVRVARDVAGRAPVAAIAPVAPIQASVHGGSAAIGRPPGRVFERPVVARTAPPAVHVGFAAQQRQLGETPGKPLDDAARRALTPAAAVPAPVVRVVAPTQAAPPTQRPPTAAPGARPDDARARSDRREAPAAPAASGTPTPPSAPRAEPPRPIAPAPAPRVDEPKPAAPQAPPPVPAVQAPEQRSRQRPEQPPAAPPPQRPEPPAAAPAPQRPEQPRAAPSQQRSEQPRAGPSQQRSEQPRAAPPSQRPEPPDASPSPPRQESPRAAPPAPRQESPRAAPPAPRQESPKAAAPPQVPPAPAEPPPPRARPEPAASPRQAEPRSAPAAPSPPAAQPQAAPKAEPAGRESRTPAADPGDRKKDRDEPKRDEDGRGRKG